MYLDSLTIFGAGKSWDWASHSALGPLCAEWVDSIELPLETELKETYIKSGSNSVVRHHYFLVRSLSWFLLSSWITSNLPSPTSPHPPTPVPLHLHSTLRALILHICCAFKHPMFKLTFSNKCSQVKPATFKQPLLYSVLLQHLRVPLIIDMTCGSLCDSILL